MAFHLRGDEQCRQSVTDSGAPQTGALGQSRLTLVLTLDQAPHHLEIFLV